MKSKSPPLPPALQEYLATRAREGGFADASDYLRALIRQQRAGQPAPDASAPQEPLPPVDAGDFERLRHRLAPPDTGEDEAESR